MWLIIKVFINFRQKKRGIFGNQEQIGLPAPYNKKNNKDRIFRKVITIFTEGNKVKKWKNKR